MKRWQIILVAGFFGFIVFTGPQGAADQVRRYGGFVYEFAGNVAEFADTAFDGPTATSAVD